jgi:hypothetical protein
VSKKTAAPRSQVLELLFSIAKSLGADGDREIAELCGVSVDNIAHWKSGATQELKPATLAAIEERLASRIHTMRERARDVDAAHGDGLVALEIEDGSGPAALQRQFLDRVRYDYCGHRFLYFEPQGALAWENLMRGGYDQNLWLAGVDECARTWLSEGGVVARVVGGGKRGLDVVALGPGEASKEASFLSTLVKQQIDPLWTACALVDVSIPLLLTAATTCRAIEGVSVLPFCADFEEGKLAFVRRLPSASHDFGARLVALLGNVFGNVREEDALLDEKLARIVRKGDFLWIEVALRFDKIEQDPLFRMTQDQAEVTAPEAARRLLLEGPYRRLEAAQGRRPSEMSTRVWLRENDETSRIPGSINFCHDLMLKDERRAVTMLFSRRYDVKGLTSWLAGRGYDVESVVPVVDSLKRARVAHVLARRR